MPGRRPRTKIASALKCVSNLRSEGQRPWCLKEMPQNELAAKKRAQNGTLARNETPKAAEKMHLPEKKLALLPDSTILLTDTLKTADGNPGKS